MSRFLAPPEEGSISPSELAILDSLIAGGTALSLKVGLVHHLPDHPCPVGANDPWHFLTSKKFKMTKEANFSMTCK
jgi:hypothetical protein